MEEWSGGRIAGRAVELIDDTPIAAFGFILWSIFLSRIRVYRSQAQDPDFTQYEKKSRRRKRREKKSRATAKTVDEAEPDEDEDDEPWI